MLLLLTSIFILTGHFLSLLRIILGLYTRWPPEKALNETGKSSRAEIEIRVIDFGHEYRP